MYRVHDMNVLTDCVNLQGYLITAATGPTSNSLLRILACQLFLALGNLFEQSQYHNLRPSFVFGTITNASAIFNSNQNLGIVSP